MKLKALICMIMNLVRLFLKVKKSVLLECYRY